MQSVLLTGATGFIGSALKLKLNDLNYNIVEINSSNGGVTNPEIFNGLLSNNFNHVFHLAGKTFVPESWEKPSLYFKINVHGTQNVLELLVLIFMDNPKHCQSLKVVLFVQIILMPIPNILPSSCAGFMQRNLI